MTTRKYSSTSQETSLTQALAAGSGNTTMVVGSATALLSGTIPGNTSPLETFTVVIDPDTALEEIVDVVYPSNPDSTTITIVRAVDGTSAIAHSAGAKVRHMASGRDFREANAHIKNETTAHGLTIADVITTTNTKTLTNKTLTSPTITGTGAIAGTFTGNLTGNVTGNVSGTSGSTTGNAATATALATGRTFQLTGDVEASGVTFDGTGNVSLTTVIGTGAIVNADINASAAIAATKIAGTAVTQADSGTVTSAMIANGAIVDADVNASAAIAKTKLNLGGTITSADLVDGTIVASDIADGTITAAKLVSDPYARANHTGSQTASTISDFNTAVRTNRLDQMAAPTGSVALNAQKLTGVADPTSAQDASTKAYVDAQVNALVDGAPGTLNTLNEIATAISSGGSFESTVVLKSGSTMTGALTLPGAPTVDLHAATKAYVDTVAGSATAAAASASAAATTYDNFDDRYLGAKSSAPTLDNDGNALLVGAIYWNSVANAMFAWTGTEWGSISSTAAIYRYRFTAAGGETTESGLDDNGLTLSYIPGKEQVYLNGVLLVRTTDYTASNGTSITSLAALTAGDILEIITFTSFELASAIEETIFDAKGDLLVGTAADTVGKIALGTNGYVLKANSATATGLEWGVYDPLPSQTGNSGKYLTTNGTATSWGTVESLGAKSISVASGLGKGPYTYTNTFAAGGYFISQGNDTGPGSLTLGSITNTLTNKGGVLSTSTTGATIDLSSIVRWNTSAQILEGADAKFLAYGNGVFVTGASNNRLSTSTDAVTWTSRNANLSGFDIFGGAYLAAASQKYVVGGSSGALSSSTDSITWTSRTSQFGTSRINKIIGGDGIYVACGYSGKVSTSTDGITWTSRSTGTSARLEVLIYAPGQTQKYVVMGGSSSTITSTDGTTWVERTGPSVGGASFEEGAYGNGIYLAAADVGQGFGYSTNGTTWSVVTRPSSSLFPTSVDFVNGYFIYGTSNDSTIGKSRYYISTNATTWTEVTNNIDTTNSFIISQFVYASDQASNKIVGAGASGSVRRSGDLFGILQSDWSANIIGPMTNTALT